MESLWAQAGMFRLSLIWPPKLQNLWLELCWHFTHSSQTGARLGSALLGVRKRHIALDWSASPGRQECHMGVRNIPWLLLAMPSVGQATFDLFLVKSGSRGSGLIYVSLVPGTPWYQHMWPFSSALGLVAQAPQQSSPALCPGSLLVLHPRHPASHAPLCWATSACEVTQGGRLAAWPGPQSPLCCSVFGFSPFLPMQHFWLCQGSYGSTGQCRTRTVASHLRLQGNCDVQCPPVISKQGRFICTLCYRNVVPAGVLLGKAAPLGVGAFKAWSLITDS